ncbi:hypothetical protein ABH945_003719 [Paraburkholderia sp. GAS333]
MSFGRVKHKFHSEPFPKISDAKFPIAEVEYRGLYSEMSGTTRMVCVAFKRLDVDDATPLHKEVSFMRGFSVGRRIVEDGLGRGAA